MLAFPRLTFGVLLMAKVMSLGWMTMGSTLLYFFIVTSLNCSLVRATILKAPELTVNDFATSCGGAGAPPG